MDYLIKQIEEFIMRNGILKPIFIILPKQQVIKPNVLMIVESEQLKNTILPFIWDHLEIFERDEIPGLVDRIVDQWGGDLLHINHLKPFPIEIFEPKEDQ